MRNNEVGKVKKRNIRFHDVITNKPIKNRLMSKNCTFCSEAFEGWKLTKNELFDFHKHESTTYLLAFPFLRLGSH